MKDFNIRKFLIENKITAASQQIREEEKIKTISGVGGDKDNLVPPYYLFSVRFSDGSYFFDLVYKGMGGMTKDEWWNSVSVKAAKEGKKEEWWRDTVNNPDLERPEEPWEKKPKYKKLKEESQSESDIETEEEEEEGEESTPEEKAEKTDEYKALGKKINELEREEAESSKDKKLKKLTKFTLLDPKRANSKIKGLKMLRDSVLNARKALGDDKVVNTRTAESYDRAIKVAETRKDKTDKSSNLAKDRDDFTTRKAEKENPVVNASVEELEGRIEDLTKNKEEHQAKVNSFVKKLDRLKGTDKYEEARAEMLEDPDYKKYREISDQIRDLEKQLAAKKKEGSDEDDKVNEGHRRWNKLKEYFNVK